MKAIFEQTGHERERLTEVLNEIKAKTQGMSLSEMFDAYNNSIFYGRYKFSGKVSDALIERLGRMPTEEEIIMLVDRGFYHFGATIKLDGRHFSGQVNTD